MFRSFKKSALNVNFITFSLMLSSSLYVEGNCGNQAFQEMAGFSSIAKAIAEK